MLFKHNVFLFSFIFVSALAHIITAGGGFDEGQGTEDDPYQVSTAEHLNNVREHLNACFIQKSDISLTDFASEEGWEPIGDESNPFTGNYDGNDKTISELVINRQEEDHVGLFGYAENAELVNITIKNANVQGHNHAGGLAGRLADNSTISGSHIKAEVYADEYYAGGLAGSIQGGSIFQCSSNSEVEAGINRAGGIVGSSTGTVEQTYSKGVIMASGSPTRAGGLIGKNESGGDIVNCYSHADVHADGTASGGLVGLNWGDIQHSYAAGHVSSEESDTGGLVGSNRGFVEGSYYDKDTTGQDDDMWKGEPRSTAEMKDETTFTGWDFAEKWEMSEPNSEMEGYPVLSWQEVPNSIRDWLNY